MMFVVFKLFYIIQGTTQYWIEIFSSYRGFYFKIKKQKKKSFPENGNWIISNQMIQSKFMSLGCFCAAV